MIYENSGNIPPAKMKNPQHAIVVVLLIALAMALAALGFLFSKENHKDKDIGFKTQEDVIEYYVDKVRQGDLDGALKAFAVNHMADNYDLAKQVDRTMAWAAGMPMLYSSKNSNFLESNRQAQAGAFMRQIVNMRASLYVDEQFLEGITVGPVAKGEGEELAQSLISPDLSSLRIKQITDAVAELGIENIKENFMEMIVPYGGEAISDYTVLYEYKGNEYLGGFVLIKYDGLWYIYAANSIIGSTDGRGVLERN